MIDGSRHDDLARLAAKVGALEGELARLRRPHCRPRRRRALVLLACLVALIPLGTLAANPFTDLNPGSPHNGNIDAIFNAGITTGCSPTEYCPNANVTRQEMASFLARTAGLGGNPPIANAKTAQTAATAQTAVNATTAQTANTAQTATNATTAQTAANAAAVGGYPANSLNRVAFTSALQSASVPNNGSLIEAARVQITIPGSAPQAVVVRAQIGLFGRPSGGFVGALLRADGGNNSDWAYYPYTTTSDSVGITIATQYVFTAQPGTHTYTLVLQAYFTAGALSLYRPSLIATTHPFGATGTPGAMDLPASLVPTSQP